MRDPLGVRPLVLGQMGNTHILASESCALDIIGATHIRDIEPGELVVIARVADLDVGGHLAVFLDVQDALGALVDRLGETEKATAGPDRCGDDRYGECREQRGQTREVVDSVR